MRATPPAQSLSRPSGALYGAQRVAPTGAGAKRGFTVLKELESLALALLAPAAGASGDPMTVMEPVPLAAAPARVVKQPAREVRK